MATLSEQFLLQSQSHTVLAIDISEMGLPEIYPTEGKLKMIPSLRFQTWKDGEQYFRRLGADPEVLESIPSQLSTSSLAILPIIGKPGWLRP